jgi:vancomycin resistance protein YoaR
MPPVEAVPEAAPVVVPDAAVTQVIEPPEHVVAPVQDESIATSTDPTPTETFAMAFGGTPRKRRRRWIAVLVVLGALAVAYGAAAFFLRDAVPFGTTIEGVPAGDNVAAATKAVEELAAVAASGEVTLTAGENTTTLDPTQAGLSVDVEATVANVGGFTLDPMVLWQRLDGEGTNHHVVVAAEEPAFTDAVNAAADQLDSTASDASVAIVGATAVVTDGSQSVTVDRVAARYDILRDWPRHLNIALTAEVTDPAVTTSEAETLAATLNGHALAGPTVLTGANGDVELPAGQVAAYSSIASTDGALTWEVDGMGLSAFILDAYPWVENEPVDATYTFTKDHKLKVTEGEPGRKLNSAALGDAVIAAASATPRSGPLPYIETQPAVTAVDVPTQDFTAIVSTFSTPLTPEPIRTRNLVRAAELITGTIVKPGERFDLTKVIGPITAKNGYYDAHVIVNGLLVNGIGGGLSQVATTTYNAGYFAGYKDITHRPHSVWFPRYPAGRESTVLNGQINVVFENNTPYAMIMNSYVANGKLTVDIWSTPYFTVKTKSSPKTNFKQPTVVESSNSNCLPKGPGQPGFSITHTRWVYLGEVLHEKRSWSWTYRPDNGIKCVD